MFAAHELWFSILARSISTKALIAAAAEQQGYEGMTAAIIILLASILAVAVLAALGKNHLLPKWLARGLEAMRVITASSGEGKGASEDEFDEIVRAAGYSYNEAQDMFYSNIDAWQREMGYCRLYDEAAAPMGMIIDCEPIYFEYGGSRWMIELWKGQYDMTTGCEVGVYNTKEPDIEIPGVFKGPFFECASDEDLLIMSYTLKKNGKTLFTRKDKHWWVTGFRVAEFSEPWELTVDVRIGLKDRNMRNAFLAGLKKAGYLEEEIKVIGNTVSLKFDKPRTKQPTTRTPASDGIIQRKNKFLCDKFLEITGPYDNLRDKIKAIQKEEPELYNEVMNIGKTRRLFDKYDIIKKYLD